MSLQQQPEAPLHPAVLLPCQNGVNVLDPVIAVVSSSLRNSVAYSIAGVWVLLLTGTGFAGQPPTVSSYRDPVELVRKAVQNEIKAASDDSARFLFRGTKTTSQGSTTRLHFDTKEPPAPFVIPPTLQPFTP